MVVLGCLCVSWRKDERGGFVETFFFPRTMGKVIFLMSCNSNQSVVRSLAIETTTSRNHTSTKVRNSPLVSDLNLDPPGLDFAGI
jgi:hypothetical protein